MFRMFLRDLVPVRIFEVSLHISLFSYIFAKLSKVGRHDTIGHMSRESMFAFPGKQPEEKNTRKSAEGRREERLRQLEFIKRVHAEVEKREKEKAKKGGSEIRESTSGKSNFWSGYKIGKRFAGYLEKKLLGAKLGRGKPSVAKPLRAMPLSMMANRENEMAANLEAHKFNPDANLTEEHFRDSALALIEEMGWQETRPEKGAEIKETETKEDDLPSLAALDKLESQLLSDELREPNGQKECTPDELRHDFATLRKTWDDTLAEFEKVGSDREVTDILDLTRNAVDDAGPLEDYLKKEGDAVRPEAKAFIESSIAIKKFRGRAKEMLGGELSKGEYQISETEFNDFLTTNKISPEALTHIVKKIESGSTLTDTERDIYSAKGRDIEGMIRANFAKKDYNTQDKK